MSQRTISDAQGTLWEVWAVNPALIERRLIAERRQRADRREHVRETPERRGAEDQRASDLASGWLAFRSALEDRRRSPIPERWEEMSEDELRRELEQAVEVLRR